MKYKYILLDIDSTLIDFKKSFDEATKVILEKVGHPVTPATVEEYFRHNDDMWFGLKLHEIHREDIRKNYHRLYREYIYLANRHAKEAMGLPGEVDELVQYFMEELGRQAVPMPGAVEICRELSKTHTLCVATNGLNEIQPGKITAFAPYLTHTFISEALDWVKPEKEYFESIVGKLGCSVSDCLMVGDSLANDIDGANSAGMDSCFYNPERLVNHSAILPTYEISDFKELLEIA